MDTTTCERNEGDTHSGQTLFEFVSEVCATAARNGEGLILAVEDGYTATPQSASDVFLRVDAEAAHHPECTFRNAELATLLDDALLPTVGVLNASSDDAEAWALRVGYARDRVVAYQRCKASVLAAECTTVSAKARRDLATLPSNIHTDLMASEEHLMKSPAKGIECANEYNADKRTAWEYRDQYDRTPSLLDNVMATCISRRQIEGFTGGQWVDEDNATRDQKLGTERFVSFAFTPADHVVMVAANATGSGVRIDESVMSYPAYVTVHNSKGAIEHMPATATEQRPNSVIVPCAASLLCELHSLSAKAGRNHVVIAHGISLKA